MHGAGNGNVYPPTPEAVMMAQLDGPGHAAANQQPGNNWAGNDANTLLVVATLITTLTYQLGSNIPVGYWQDTQPAGPGNKGHTTGDPVMRDLHAERYWAFMAASWMGFGGSMMMTVSLLMRMPVESRHVRWSFAVAYASLVLTFRLSQPKTHISLEIIIWVAVVALLWLTISVRAERRARFLRVLCCAGDN
ncbi:hypothetical protein U9M48_006862 [Paspalum notatum var. saurae]|uniref:PGG domain-containing protein n=1 Tax=Paspalum notatum var. saurae TaxID=547442 RepID=A0AAQ3Q0S8_PASNO